jgi:hypothetical protein
MLENFSLIGQNKLERLFLASLFLARQFVGLVHVGRSENVLRPYSQILDSPEKYKTYTITLAIFASESVMEKKSFSGIDNLIISVEKNNQNYSFFSHPITLANRCFF